MKKLLFSVVVLLGAMGICVSNSSKTNAQVPAVNHSYIVKDTVPRDTMRTKDSTLMQVK